MNFRCSPLSLLASLCFFLLLASPLGISAQQIAFTHSGNGSGSIGAISFTDADFSIYELADTANRVQTNLFGSAGFYIDDTSASINISGVGSFNFTISTRTFVNNTTATVGFARALDFMDLFDGPSTNAFQTWDMLSSIGPITTTGEIVQWNTPPVTTDGGVLVFNTALSVPATFEATLIPEPCSCNLMIWGVAWVTIRLLRSRNSLRST